MDSERFRDYCASALLIGLGLSISYIGRGYQIGSLTNMGPGFFPAVLGLALAGTGVLIAITTGRGGRVSTIILTADQEMRSAPDLRGWCCIIAGMLSFIVLVLYAGLIPATFGCVLISSLGDRSATVKGSLVLALGVTVFAVGLFSYILKVQIPLLRGL